MNKKIRDEFPTKAKKRELKKRPRMKVHGASLKRTTPYAGKALTSK